MYCRSSSVCCSITFFHFFLILFCVFAVCDCYMCLCMVYVSFSVLWAQLPELNDMMMMMMLIDQWGRQEAAKAPWAPHFRTDLPLSYLCSTYIMRTRPTFVSVTKGVERLQFKRRQSGQVKCRRHVSRDAQAPRGVRCGEVVSPPRQGYLYLINKCIRPLVVFTGLYANSGNVQIHRCHVSCQLISK